MSEFLNKIHNFHWKKVQKFKVFSKLQLQPRSKLHRANTEASKNRQNENASELDHAFFRTGHKNKTECQYLLSKLVQNFYIFSLLL